MKGPERQGKSEPGLGFKHHLDFCSFTQSCVTLCDPMDCSTPGSLVLHYLPESAQTHIHWVDDAIQPSHPLLPPSTSVLNLSQPRLGMSWLLTSGSQSTGGSVLPRNIQGWFPLWLTGLISLLSKGPSRVFSSMGSQSEVWGPRSTPRTFPRSLWSSFPVCSCSDYTSGWSQIFFLHFGQTTYHNR